MQQWHKGRIWDSSYETRGNSPRYTWKPLGIRQANSRILCRITKDQGLYIVEGWAFSETEKEIMYGVGAGNVGVPATGEFCPPSLEKKSIGSLWWTWIDWNHIRERSRLAPLRREWWQRLDSSRCRKNRATRRRHEQKPRERRNDDTPITIRGEQP
jgi:hypothetical protein